MLAALAAALLAGCGGGGTHAASNPVAAVPAAPSTPVADAARGTGTVAASATLSAGRLPQFAARSTSSVRRLSLDAARRTLGAVTSVEVDGTLYQGSASAQRVTNVQTFPVAADGTVSVNETFTNVVPANNDWIVFEYYAIAADGSKIDIGTLATLVNVAATGTTASALGAASTQVVQIALPLLRAGVLSTDDIEQNPKLASQLAAQIAATGAAPNPQTNVFDPATVQSTIVAIAPAYERDLTINTTNGSGVEQFTLTWDASQTDENDLAYNVQSLTLGPSGSAFIVPYLAGLGVVTPAGAPVSSYRGGPGSGYGYASVSGTAFTVASATSQHAVPLQVTGTVLGASPAPSITVKNVYGGHLIAGAYDPRNVPTPGPSPSAGAASPSPTPVPTALPAGALPAPIAHTLMGTATVAPAAPGAVTAAAVTLADHAQSIPVADPQITAFQSAGVAYNVNTAVALELRPPANGVVPQYNTTCVYVSAGCNGDTGSLQSSSSGKPQIFSLTGSVDQSGNLTADLFNVFNVPVSAMEICSLTTCTPIGSGTIPLQSPFFDPATNVGVYNWTAAAPATISTTAPGVTPPEYVVAAPTPSPVGAGSPTPGPTSTPFVVALSATVPASIQPLTGSTLNVYLDIAPFIQPVVSPFGVQIPSLSMPMTATVTDTSGATYSGTGSCYIPGGYNTTASCYLAIAPATPSVTTPLATVHSVALTFAVMQQDVSKLKPSPQIGIRRIYLSGTFGSSGGGGGFCLFAC